MISVILPVYNGERFIKDSIDSILNQTHKDFELIIINDCSTDKTLSIIEKFHDNRIKIINNKINKGIVYSLNKGITEAKGDYIARMDADDICDLHRLEYQYNYIVNHNVDLVGTSYVEINENNDVIDKIVLPETNDEIKATLLLKNCIAHPSILIKTNILKHNQYSNNYKYAEDYELWTRLMNNITFYNLPIPLLKYRINYSGMTMKANKDIKERIDVLKDIFKNNIKTSIMLTDEDIKLITKVINCLDIYQCEDKLFLKVMNMFIFSMKDLYNDEILKEIVGFSWLRYSRGKVFTIDSIKYYCYGIKYYRRVRKWKIK